MEKIIKLTPTELIAIPVTEHAEGFFITSYGSLLYTDEIINAVTLVEKCDIIAIVKKGNITSYSDDSQSAYVGMINNESFFKKLLSSHGIMFENPYGEEFYPMAEKYDGNPFQLQIDMKQWQTAQDSLVKKIVILKPI